MTPFSITLLIVVCVALLALIVWKPLRNLAHQVSVERARELFRLQRERLQQLFFVAASSSGKPRGLRWQELQWDSELYLARDKQTKQLVGLVGITIQFEAIEGSDMEGHSEVGHLRNASAVFFIERGHWETIGKTVFNMNPDEALEHFRNQYDPIDPKIN